MVSSAGRSKKTSNQSSALSRRGCLLVPDAALVVNSDFATAYGAAGVRGDNPSSHPGSVAGWSGKDQPGEPAAPDPPQGVVMPVAISGTADMRRTMRQASVNAHESLRRNGINPDGTIAAE
jgi:hypothetical protein